MRQHPNRLLYGVNSKSSQETTWTVTVMIWYEWGLGMGGTTKLWCTCVCIKAEPFKQENRVSSQGIWLPSQGTNLRKENIEFVNCCYSTCTM